MSEEIVYGHITRTAGVCGGKPRVAGQRIKVKHLVVEHEQMGMCPDEICSVHPSLTLAEVHAALAYYFDHREEIQADLQADEAYLQESMQRAPDNMGTA